MGYVSGVGGGGGVSSGSPTVLQAYLSMWKHFTDFGSRTTRATYWKAAAVNIVIYFVLYAVTLSSNSTGAISIVSIYSLAALVPGLAIAVRRLHDSNHSGGWIFLAVIPIVGSLAVLVFMLLPSSQGDNRYGSTFV